MEFARRPSVRRVRVVAGEAGKRREGPDLNDVVRTIIWDLKHETGWSQARLSRELGIPQQRVSRLLDSERHGMTLWVLSQICAALGETPVQFFRRYSDAHSRRRGRR